MAKVRYIIILLLIIFTVSCTEVHRKAVVLSKISINTYSDNYRVKILNDSTIRYTSRSKSTPYLIGDTIWVDYIE